MRVACSDSPNRNQLKLCSLYCDTRLWNVQDNQDPKAEHLPSGWWVQPLWKMLINRDDDIPKIWKNKIHVPNHQPVIVSWDNCPCPRLPQMHSLACTMGAAAWAPLMAAEAPALVIWLGNTSKIDWIMPKKHSKSQETGGFSWQPKWNGSTNIWNRWGGNYNTMF